MKIGSIAVGVLLAACLAVFASCGLGESKVPTPERGQPSVIKGELWFAPLHTEFSGSLGDPCEVDSDSYDLHAGTPVVVKDVAGSAVATGQLEPGVIVDLSFAVENGCRFDFTVKDVPVSAYYQIEVGNASASFSYDELESMNWTVRWGVGE